jgi:hypothetical protein
MRSNRQRSDLGRTLKPRAIWSSAQEYTAISGHVPVHHLTIRRARRAAENAVSKSRPAALASLLSIC